MRSPDWDHDWAEFQVGFLYHTDTGENPVTPSVLYQIFIAVHPCSWLFGTSIYLFYQNKCFLPCKTELVLVSSTAKCIGSFCSTVWITEKRMCAVKWFFFFTPLHLLNSVIHLCICTDFEIWKSHICLKLRLLRQNLGGDLLSVTEPVGFSTAFISSSAWILFFCSIFS